MTDLFRYAAALESAGVDISRSLPPVERWNPDYCGELDLVIKADGTWVHEGTPIGRARLVRLFSTILKREGERHFLVTPVEKLGIVVEDSAFTAILMAATGTGETQNLVFTTNVGDQVLADAAHEIVYRRQPGVAEAAPYIHVRGGLEARISRAVFYDLVALAETREMNAKSRFGVWSSGEFFALADSADVFE